MEPNSKPPATPPGWNDPPPLQFDPTKTFSTTKNKLNKRIAFPGISSQTAAQIHQPQGIAPPLNTGPPPIAIFNPTNSEKPPEIDKTFIKVLWKFVESSVHPESQTKFKESLEILENKLEQNELDRQLMEDLSEFANALETKDTKVTAIYQKIASSPHGSESWAKCLKELAFKSESDH